MNQNDVLVPPTFISGNSSALTRILFLGDGYLANEQGKFRNDVDTFFQGLLAVPDYAPYTNKIAALRAEVRSPQSGVDDPNISPQKTTAFELSYGASIRRCIWFQSSQAQQAAKNLRDQAGATVVVVIGNDDEYGGCASQGVIAISRNSASLDILAHELGHAIFNLVDEYGGQSCGRLTRALGINVSSSSRRDQLPWADLVLPNTPLPTSSSGPHSEAVGAFQGGGHCDNNRWRPQHTCLMRELGTPMCAVCAREMRRFFGPAGQDAGVEPVDAGVEPVDAGVEPVDAGVEPVDAGVEPVDAGVEPVDAGVEPVDAGVDPVDAGSDVTVLGNGEGVTFSVPALKFPGGGPIALERRGGPLA